MATTRGEKIERKNGSRASAPVPHNSASASKHGASPKRQAQTKAQHKLSKAQAKRPASARRAANNPNRMSAEELRMREFAKAFNIPIDQNKDVIDQVTKEIVRVIREDAAKMKNLPGGGNIAAAELEAMASCMEREKPFQPKRK